MAVVTAAAGAGVGHAIAGRFAQAGGTVVISDVHEGRLRRTCDELGVEGAVVDVADERELVDHLHQVIARHGRIDILASCAGVNEVVPAVDLAVARWRHVLDVNLTAPFVGAATVLPGMVDRGWGSIINIASVAAWLPSRDQAAYQATKAGLLGLTRALAFESAAAGVRVNAIAPGLVDNPYLANVYGEAGVRRLRDQIPMGRPAAPEEIAAAALWLASDESAYVTGECITVAGGWYMRA